MKILYADDTNFGSSAYNTIELLRNTNNSAYEFQKYCKANGLIVNTNKSQILTFLSKNMKNDFSYLVKPNGSSVQQTNSCKFLGIVIDNKITWEDHFYHAINKLIKLSLFPHKAIKKSVSPEVLKLAYFGLAESILSFGLIFWGCLAHIEWAFCAQKKIIRAMIGI